MAELPALYPHQEQMRDDVRHALAVHRRVILQAPPGTGKTRLAKWIMGSYENREKRPDESGNAMFAVHRRGLVDNASDSFSESPKLHHGIKKVVPDAETMEVAYRRALEIEHIKRQFDGLKAEAEALSESAKVPPLSGMIAKALKEDPTMPWDRVIADLAAIEVEVS